jgi:hypothetical protein
VTNAILLIIHLQMVRTVAEMSPRRTTMPAMVIKTRMMVMTMKKTRRYVIAALSFCFQSVAALYGSSFDHLLTSNAAFAQFLEAGFTKLSHYEFKKQISWNDRPFCTERSSKLSERTNLVWIAFARCGQAS